MLQYFKKTAPPSHETADTTIRSHDETVSSKSGSNNDSREDLDASNVTIEDGQTRPFLSDEDELLLLRIASKSDGDGASEAPPLPPRQVSGSNTIVADLEDAGAGVEPSLEAKPDNHASRQHGTPNRTEAARRWAEGWIQWGIKPTQDLALARIRELSNATHAVVQDRQRASDRRLAANTLTLAADSVKSQSGLSREENVEAGMDSHEAGKGAKEERAEEQKEVGSILSHLDLSSINNRVVGVSKDTQKLLESFNQVLKDIVNGVPTAYDDLEKLLTERQGQLDKLYGSLPPFLQGLVKAVPVKVYAAMAPQVAAAMSAEKSKEGDRTADEKGNKKKKSRLSIPTLKTLIGQKGVVAGMLRSIIGFLEARFPLLLTGTNVIVSLAVFILLFVFWYCHKRGREARLANLATGSEADDKSSSDLEKCYSPVEGQHLSADHIAPVETDKATPGTVNDDNEKKVNALVN